MIEFVDDFVKDVFTGLVAVDFDKQAESFVMLENGESFVVELLESGAKGFDVFVVGAVTTIV